MLNRKDRKKAEKEKKRQEKLKKETLKQEKLKNKAKKVENIQYGKDLILDTEIGDFTIKDLTLKKELRMDIYHRRIEKVIDRQAIQDKYPDDLRKQGLEIMEQVLDGIDTDDIAEIGQWGIDNILELKDISLLPAFQTVYLILVRFTVYRYLLKKK